MAEAHHADAASPGASLPARDDVISGRLRGDALLAICLAGALGALAFLTTGSVDQIVTAADTWSEIAVTGIGAGACAAVILTANRGRLWGGATIALFAVLTALTAISITWSVQPDDSWFAANEMFSYLAAFAGAAALARLAPHRWPAIVGAIALLTAALSGYALLAKVFPAALNPTNAFGRLQAPFGYWNAVGISAALGLPACLWAGSRRHRARWVGALSALGLALMMTVVVLSYSRSAALAAVLGTGAWIVFVPLRLRAVAMLALGAVGAAAITGWALATPALTSDGASSATRSAAGHTFGVVLVVVLGAVTAAGFAAASAIDRVALAAVVRRRVGAGLVMLVALVPVAGVVAVAASPRGLTGEISHTWTTLTQVDAVVADTPGRLVQFGSSRPRYWHEGLQVGDHALLHGVGALGFATARLRYSIGVYKVDKAHSYPVQTFADLGLIGVAITLALLVSWCLAAARALALRTGWRSLTPGQVAERQGLSTLAIIVVIFGVQSAIDWTWYFPGVAISALVCAGWLAGRGPLSEPIGRSRQRRPISRRPGAVAALAALASCALLGAWVLWQPLRSAQDYAATIQATSNPQAFADARAAIASDPLGYRPLFLLSALYERIQDTPGARAQLVRATQVQSQNPTTWFALGSFDLRTGDPRQALRAMTRAVALDPTLQAARGGVLQARAALAGH